MAVFRRHVDSLSDRYERFALQAVSNQVLNAYDLKAVLLGKLQQLGQTRHGAVVIHYLHQRSGRIESRQFAQVDGSLSVSAAAQHAVVLGVQGIDVSRASESLRR